MQQLWRWSLLVLALALTTGCGSGDTGGDKGSGTGDTGSGTTEGEGGGEEAADLTNLPEWTKDGNTYFFPTSSNIPTLDPAQISDTTSDSVCNQIFDTLLTLDDDLKIAGDLATSWTIDPDNVTYHFTITDKAKFHNGRTVEAKDVEYTIKRVLDPKIASKRSNWATPILGGKAFNEGTTTDLPGVVVVSPTELTIKLEEPYAPFIYHLAQQTFGIIPQEEAEKAGKDQFTLQPVGSGPFKFVDWKQNQYVVLQANPDYWKGAPKLSGMVYKVIKEPRQQLEEYKRGNLHHCWVEPVNVWPIVQGEPELMEQVHRYPLASLMYYGFNMTKAPFGVPPDKANDPAEVEKARKLRYAVNYAIDRKYIVEKIMADQGVPYSKIIPPGLGDYVSPTDVPMYDFNPTKAGELLKEAGYPNGEGLPEAELWFNKEGSHPDIAAAIQNDLQKVGIKVVSKTLEWASYIEAVDKGDPQIFRMGWIQDYPDPDNWLYIMFHSSNHGPLGNTTFYTNPEVDKLLKDAQINTVHAERMAMYQKAEELILKDAPWAIIEHGINVLLLKPEVEGMTFTAVDSADTIQHVNFAAVSLKK